MTLLRRLQCFLSSNREIVDVVLVTLVGICTIVICLYAGYRMGYRDAMTDAGPRRVFYSRPVWLTNGQYTFTFYGTNATNAP